MTNDIFSTNTFTINELRPIQTNKNSHMEVSIHVGYLYMLSNASWEAPTQNRIIPNE